MKWLDDVMKFLGEDEESNEGWTLIDGWPTIDIYRRHSGSQCAYVYGLSVPYKTLKRWGLVLLTLALTVAAGIVIGLAIVGSL